MRKKANKNKKGFNWSKFFKKGLIRLAYRSFEIPFFLLAGVLLGKLIHF
jgi:hypothetical protein